MRFVFYSFLVLNVVYFGWKLVESAGRVGVAPQTSYATPEDKGRQIVLLSEKDVLVPASPALYRRDKMTLCSAVGPFVIPQKAREFVKTLEKGGYRSKTQEVAVKADSIHWVFLPPYPTMGQALQKLAELQSQKIDSYVVTEGEFQYGISLGYFSKQDSAKGLKNKLVTAGLPARIQEQQRHNVELWVSVDPETEKKDDGALLDMLLEEYNYDSRQKALCDFSSSP